jgi:hypothetical protein
MIVRHSIGLAVVLAIASWAGHATGKGSCAVARAELDQSQAAMSAAVRDADARAADYHACMQQSGNKGAPCSAKRRALDVAVARKRGALDAYHFALARVKQACG